MENEIKLDRPLLKVVNAILSIIIREKEEIEFNDYSTIISKLNSLRKEIRYAAPEVRGPLWERLGIILQNNLEIYEEELWTEEIGGVICNTIDYKNYIDESEPEKSNNLKK